MPATRGNAFANRQCRLEFFFLGEFFCFEAQCNRLIKSKATKANCSQPSNTNLSINTQKHTMCQLTSTRVVNVPTLVLNKSVLANVPQKEEESPKQEFGSYGDYWGVDELAFPVKTTRTFATSSSSGSLKSVEMCSSYGSYWGLDQE